MLDENSKCFVIFDNYDDPQYSNWTILYFNGDKNLDGFIFLRLNLHDSPTLIHEQRDNYTFAGIHSDGCQNEWAPHTIACISDLRKFQDHGLYYLPISPQLAEKLLVLYSL